jgi:hypothetical protein
MGWEIFFGEGPVGLHMPVEFPDPAVSTTLHGNTQVRHEPATLALEIKLPEVRAAYR